ncbi:MAG: TIGR01777 family oxidoreductase [Candidatus Eremiobacteraeota bacterium]|nr:TIGR01777 family oxidoreductase [Candidatus Eremiobacteraeota bacterium]
MRVLILGASGFIGKHLARALERRGDDVETRSLRDPEAAAAAASACDAAINLAGESLAQRWSPAVKARIETSRTELPRRFIAALAARERRPSIYVSSSAVGYYGTSESAEFDESSPPGDDFLARVCKAWEDSASGARALGMRVAIVRLGVVLGTDGGALAKMLPPFRAGLGGVAGSGRQWLSWIHIDDAVGAIVLALDRGDGATNATAPNPVTNAEFSKTLGRVLGRPTVAPVPALALKMLLGEAADVVLKGQRVLPKRLAAEFGFEWQFPRVEAALGNLLHRDAKL